MKETATILREILGGKKTQAQLELVGACDPPYTQCPCGTRVLLNESGEGRCVMCGSPVIKDDHNFDDEPLPYLVEVVEREVIEL